MPSLEDLWVWRKGPAEGHYLQKLLFFFGSLRVVLVKVPQGGYIDYHVEPLKDKRLFQLNLVLQAPRQGGDFVVLKPLWYWRGVTFFRPDHYDQHVTNVRRGTLRMLKILWERPPLT